MADVFISYHENSAGELVEQIADALDSAGISYWCARRNLPPGAVFSDYIPQAIRNCKIFLLVLNEESNQSEHVKNELNLAFRRINKHEQIALIPFKVDNCIVSDSIDYFINRFQITNAIPPEKRHVQELIRQIADILKDELPMQSQETPLRIIRSGLCGYEAMFALDENGVLTIFGVGEMRNFGDGMQKISFKSPWWDKHGIISQVQIKDGITSIGTHSFSYCPNLTSVVIPESVISIGDSAFRACFQLNTVIIPYRTAYIGNWAFYDCPNLTNVTVSAHSKVGANSFPENAAIVRIIKSGSCGEHTIYTLDENGVLTIFGTGNMQDYLYFQDVPWYREREMISCVQIQDGVTSIGRNAFAICYRLTSVSIPDSVTKILGGTFFDCVNLKSASISANTWLHPLAFFNSSVVVTRREKTNSPG